MTRRIVFTGSESTGKSTLAQQLAAALGTDWIPEYSRDYAELRDGVLSADDVEPIARGQVAREDDWAATHPSAREVVLDTDLVSTTVYAEFYYGRCPPWILEEAQRRLGDLYLLCDLDLPWLADGVRDQPHARLGVHTRFEERLAAFGANVVTVSGVGDRRLQAAMAAVRGWRAALR